MALRGRPLHTLSLAIVQRLISVGFRGTSVVARARDPLPFY